MRKFGLLAFAAAWGCRMLLAPMVPGSWFAASGLIVLMLPVVAAAWALWVITQDAPRKLRAFELT